MKISLPSKNEESWNVRIWLKSSQMQGQEPILEQSYLYHGILRFDSDAEIYHLSYTEKDELGKGEVSIVLSPSNTIPNQQEAYFMRKGRAKLQLKLKMDSLVRQASYHSEYGEMSLPYLAKKVEHDPSQGHILLQYELFPETPDVQQMRIMIKYAK